MYYYNFTTWQKLYIESLKYGPITINQAIHTLIKDGIIGFLVRFGYVLDISNYDFGDIIATVMYRMEYNKQYIVPTRKNVNFNDEFYQDFQETISEEDWNSFWIGWNNDLDNLFDYKNDGRLVLQLQDVIWMFIDFEKSPKIVQYIKQKEDELKAIKEQEKLNKIDPYILDQINNRFIHPKFEN